MDRIVMLVMILVVGGLLVRGVDAEGHECDDLWSLLDLKECADFANWPGKTGPVRSIVPAVLEAAGRSELPVPSVTWIDRDGIPRYLLRYDFGWEVVIGESGADVQEHLIRWYDRCCASGPIVPERDDPAVAGDISFFRGAAVFRDNILVLFNRGLSGGASASLKAAEIDSLLLSQPAYPSAAPLKPIIGRFELASHPVLAGENTPLHIEASNPPGGAFGYLFANEPLWAGRVNGVRNSLGPYHYQGGADGGQEELTLIVWNDAGFTAAERMEITVLGPNAPYLVLSPPHLNFRRVTVGESRERSFTITNRGFRDVAVTGISSNSTEFRVPSTSFVLPPPGREEIVVTFSPGSEVGRYAALSVGTDADWQAEVTVWLTANLGVAETPWPMFGHDLRNTSQSTFDGPSSPQLQWRTLTEKAIDTSLAIGVDGTIHVGAGYSHLYALKPTGELRWKAPSGNLVRCAPAIGSDGTIYAGSDDSRLLALKPTGELLWSYWGEDRANARAPAIGPDGTIYVLFGNGAVHALAPGGALEWKCRVGGPIRTSPAVGPGGTIFVTSYDRWLYAISPAGAVQWKFRIPTGSQSPVIGPGGTVYVASTDSHLYALTPEGGLKWKYETESEATHQPAVGADGTIYVGLSSGSLEALRPTGQRRWRCEVAAGGYLGTPTLGADGTIYVASRRRIYALSQDGSPQWDYGTDANIRGQPVIGTHGALYFALADGSVCALGSAQTAVAEIAAGPLPSDYALDQNVPNPFNSCTAIKFALAGSGDAQLTVYNLGGQRVAALVQEARAPGRYTITWDGRDDRGRTLATGVYLYRLRAGAHTLTRKLLLLR